MKIIALLAFVISLSLSSQNSFALSDYGRTCDDNSNCKKCRDIDVKCQLCMNKCWNAFGPPEPTFSKKDTDGREELCRIKRAKWCAAQCWDPDDLTNPDYISTKPKCGNGSFPKYKDENQKPW
jgi:hypothetical protein